MGVLNSMHIVFSYVTIVSFVLLVLGHEEH